MANRRSLVPEQTPLSPADEERFLQWIADNHIMDLDHPDSHYDYRGFWQQNPDFVRALGQHLTDQFKQHGHPTFSQESQYSSGPFDGGMWIGPQADIFLEQPKIAVSHPKPSRR